MFSDFFPIPCNFAPKFSKFVSGSPSEPWKIEKIKPIVRDFFMKNGTHAKNPTQNCSKSPCILSYEYPPYFTAGYKHKAKVENPFNY